jgi:hypothetical protein
MPSHEKKEEFLEDRELHKKEKVGQILGEPGEPMHDIEGGPPWTLPRALWLFSGPSWELRGSSSSVDSLGPRRKLSMHFSSIF